jgi:hypothetical protein
MSRAEARRWLHGMLHGLPCLPCADATAPVTQPCYPATEPNSYRSLRYHFIVRLTLTSSHPWPQRAWQAAGGRPHDGMGSRYMHRSLTRSHAPSVCGPHRHGLHKKVAARRSVLPTSRGHAFESLAQWALSATTVANLCRSWRPLAWPGRGQHRHCMRCHWGRHWDAS